jgi:hypothetical protein
MAKGPNNVVNNTIPVRQVKEINTQTDLDLIVAYLNDPNPNARLSKKLEELLKRARLAYDTYRSKGSINAAINLLTKPDAEGNTISRRTARRDIDLAVRIYSDGIEHNRKLNVDIALEEIQKDLTSARIAKDFKAVVRLHELKKKYIDDHMGDSAAELYKDLQPHTIIIGKFPEKLKTPLPPDDILLLHLEELKKRKVSDLLEAEEVQYIPNDK